MGSTKILIITLPGVELSLKGIDSLNWQIQHAALLRVSIISVSARPPTPRLRFRHTVLAASRLVILSAERGNSRRYLNRSALSRSKGSFCPKSP